MVTLKCKKEKKDWSIDVDIHIRGGNKLKLTLMAHIIVPSVSIVQNEFNFGSLSYNEKSMRKLTFKNQSMLSARIIVDLRHNEELQDFHVNYLI